LGCAATSAPGHPALPRLLAERGLPLSLLAAIEPSDEMKSWAQTVVPPSSSAGQRADRLLSELLHRKENPLRYRAGDTVSVAEAWQEGFANCLTFSLLYVQLAREIGLDAYHLRVREVERFDREGDLVVAVGHVTAAIGHGPQRHILEFSDRPIRPYHDVSPISDRAALALFYSNLGAEAVRRGERERAVETLSWATRIDEDLPDVWVNFGVSLRREGDPEGAERAYRRAIELDRGFIPAYHNLTQLLDRQGRRDEANALLAAAAHESLRNPWAALGLGDLALRAGRLDEAERFYRSASRNAAESPEPWAALGAWALASGDRDRARRFLDRALRIDPTNPRAVRLRQQLEGSAATS